MYSINIKSTILSKIVRDVVIAGDVYPVGADCRSDSSTICFFV